MLSHDPSFPGHKHPLYFGYWIQDHRTHWLTNQAIITMTSYFNVSLISKYLLFRTWHALIWCTLFLYCSPLPQTPAIETSKLLWFQMFITRVSEVIMFSPCVFVCVCVCLCLSRCLSRRFSYEGLVPRKQDFAGWGCLDVQVMFRALVTPSMTSSGHKVSQILKFIYLR